ncbi:MAG TPA: hypothetical protein VFN24_07045 [Microbacterium sp.]|nr:hypothetical protein [Microbacterium sp.]
MTEHDPTRVTSQTALQGGRRRRWLIPAGIFAAISLALFIAALQLQTAVPVIGIAVVASVYAAMLVAAGTIRAARARNRTLAWLMGAMAFGALACAVALAFIEWTP